VTAPLSPQTESVGDIFVEGFSTGFVEVGALTALTLVCALGPGALARGLRFTLRKERGGPPLTVHQLESVGRTLLLAERTWLALGLVALMIPWLGAVASIASVLRGEGQLATPGSLPTYGLLIVIDVVAARLVLGGAGRAALARALERGDGIDPTAAVTSRVSDALLHAHLIVPPLWFLLMFYRLPA